MKEKATIYDLRRMCKTFSQCVGCPLEFEACNLCAIKGMTNKQFETLNAIVSNWCKEHSAKTRQDKFLEMFPNAMLYEKDYVKICPKEVDRKVECKCATIGCDDCQKSYWLAEVEENE